jgi:acyl-CoA synthetase (AMP-forming)/AMP-acid ligase II
VFPLDRWNAAHAAQAIRWHRLTTGMIITTHMFDWTQEPDGIDKSLSSMRSVQAGGKPDDIVEEFGGRFGVVMNRAWGSSEILSSTMVYADDRESYGVSDGREQPGTEIIMVDAETGEPMDPYGTGEPLVRGPALFQGYLGRADLTAAVVTADGYYRTRDIVLRNEHGVHLLGRTADTIRRGGLSIFPAEIESMLRDHDDIVEAVLVSVPDERLGERAAAIVVLRPGRTWTTEAMTAYLKQRGLTVSYMPEHLVLVNEIPKNANSKIDRQLLRQVAQESLTRELSRS